LPDSKYFSQIPYYLISIINGFAAVGLYKYDTLILNKFNNMGNKSKQDTRKTTWAKFTYIGIGKKFIMKLFKNTTLKIAFTTKNNTGRLLSIQHNHNQNKFDKCGVYQLTCPDCNKKYTGQTSRPFHIRFQENFRNYKYSNSKSKFTQHLLDNEYSTGPIENIMDIVHTTSKGRMSDTMEKIYIYKETKINNQINNKWTVRSNIIFKTLVQKDTNRAHTTPRQPGHPHTT
jgi:hypothetical protein